ncbi:hypothetical protein CQS04_09180 [Chryseomicrobium excrementi]|uniref:Uncharacterized protein n=1 Tax=Chryseomicrobium excrementi TaxID=2041346 RepID=A0A2M9EXZ1_9BACL|nr:hypothetical protein CQS04_09180 [Chryseomicrobium excrementi]
MESSCERQKSPQKSFASIEAKSATIATPDFYKISRSAFSTSKKYFPGNNPISFDEMREITRVISTAMGNKMRK